MPELSPAGHVVDEVVPTSDTVAPSSSTTTTTTGGGQVAAAATPRFTG